jgi:hypothetical protein
VREHGDEGHDEQEPPAPGGRHAQRPRQRGRGRAGSSG